MDKLKPVLANKFWILCALALVLPPSGWFLGARQLVKESLQRKTALETTFGKAKLSGTVPNQSWADAVEKRTAVQETYFRAAAEKLWNRQKRLMAWPPTVASLMSGAAYRKPAANQNIAANNFRSAYYIYLRQIWKIVDPVGYPRPGGQPVSKDHVGKIVLDWETIPKISEGTWRELPPTSGEMWDAQEDVWLVTALLRSIADVNRDATNIADASIRQIETLRLMGGNRNSGDAGAAGAAGAAGGAMAAGGGMSAAEAAVDVGGGIGGGPGFIQRRSLASGQVSGRAGSNKPVDFPPEDEFGSAAGAPVGAPEGGAAVDADAAGMGAAGMDATGMGAAGMGLVAPKERRYIDDDPDLPFRTRGFYLKVLMDHRRLPELVAALTNADFPVEIVRIQQQDHVSDMTRRATSARTARRGATTDPGGADTTDDRGFGGRLGRRSSFGGRGGFRSRTGVVAGGSSTEPSDASALDAEARQTVKKALDDPELSWVVLQGLMTLYLPPKFEQQASAADGTPSAGTSSPTGTSPANKPLTPKTATGGPIDHPPLPATSQPASGKTSHRKQSTSNLPVPERPPVPGDNVRPGKKKGPAAAEPPKPGSSAVPGKPGKT